MQSALRGTTPTTLALAATVVGAGATYIGYLTKPVAPLIALVAISVAALIVARPIAGLYLAVATVPLELATVSLGDAGFSPMEGILVLTGFVWAIKRLATGQVPYVPSPIGGLLALLVLTIVPGLVLAPQNFPALLKTIVMWMSFFFVYQMMVADSSRRTGTIVLLLLSISAAAVGIVSIVNSGGALPELVDLGGEATGRALGSFESPNILGNFEALAMPGALALALRGPVVLRPLAWATLPMILAGLALSLSRGGLLGAAFGLGVMVLWQPFRRAAVMFAVLVVALSSLDLVHIREIQYVDLVVRRLESIDNEINPRWHVWSTTPEILSDHPVFGVGTYTFPEVAPRYGLIEAETALPYEHAHSVPLTIAAERGLFGLAVLAAVGIAVIRLMIRALRRSTGGTRPVAFAVIGALTAVALHGAVDYTLGSNPLVALTFILLGLVTLLAAEQPGEHLRLAPIDENP